MNGLIIFLLIFFIITGYLKFLHDYPHSDTYKKIQRQKYEKEQAAKIEEERFKVIYKEKLKSLSKKLEPGYAVRKDAKIVRIPKKYIPAIKNRFEYASPPHYTQLFFEFINNYPYWKL